MEGIDTNMKGPRALKKIKIDMTPMVDLGFLLITFFIFTSALSGSNAMKLYMPADGPPSNISEENVLSIIVSSQKIWVYEGKWADAKNGGKVRETTLTESGIGKLIGEKTSRMQAAWRSGKLMVLIKPLDSAGYGQLVDLLDEMLIHDVPSYAIVEPSAEERAWYAN